MPNRRGITSYHHRLFDTYYPLLIERPQRIYDDTQIPLPDNIEAFYQMSAGDRERYLAYYRSRTVSFKQVLDANPGSPPIGIFHRDQIRRAIYDMTDYSRAKELPIVGVSITHFDIGNHTTPPDTISKAQRSIDHKPRYAMYHPIGNDDLIYKAYTIYLTKRNTTGQKNSLIRGYDSDNIPVFELDDQLNNRVLVSIEEIKEARIQRIRRDALRQTQQEEEVEI